MHERRRTERGFAGVTKIEVSREILSKPLRVADRNLIKQIVGMLPVMQRLAIPRFSGLEKKWVTATAFGERIKAHHQAETELGVLTERVGIHGHEPVWRVDPIIAAA